MSKYKTFGDGDSEPLLASSAGMTAGEEDYLLNKPRVNQTTYQQLKLVLWKNMLQKKRSWRGTLTEVLVPVLFILLLVMIRGLVKVKHIKEDMLTGYNFPVTESSVGLTVDCACGHYQMFRYGGSQRFAPLAQVAIVPQKPEDKALIGPLTDHLRKKFLEGLENSKAFINITNYDCVNADSVDLKTYVEVDMFRTDFESEKELIKYIEHSGYSKKERRPIMIGMVVGKDTDVEHSWSLKFRTNYTRNPDTRQTIYKFVTYFELDMWVEYLSNGVASLKMFTDQFIIQQDAVVDDAFVPEEINILPFPEEKHKKDNIYNYIGNLFGLMLVCAFMWPFSRLVRNMVEEKEKRIREGMQMMGLQNSVFGLSWAITYFIIFSVFIISATILGNLSFFQYSDASLIFVFYTLYVCTLIALAMLVTAFFSRAKTAGTLSIFVLFGAYLPYIAVSSPSRSVASKTASCLLSPVAFSLGGTHILQYESSFQGITWSTIGDTNENFNLATALVMMSIDIFLYVFFAWYFDLVLPKEFGTHKPWYFLFTSNYWCPSSVEDTSTNPALLPPGAQKEMKDHHMLIRDNEDSSVDVPHVHREEVPDALKHHVGVRTVGLTKKFAAPDGGDHFAVNHLDLELYKGQIFAFLGHNGAGKSTTINMLTGMMPISTGAAYITGLSIETQMAQIRKTMGICPQHDILFDTLTVKEHLEFYGTLKGVHPSALEAEVDKSIREVQMIPQKDQASKSLSGGQKRRLSLAIALIGGSSVVFLDEPTSGVDPFSRRAIWNLLTKKKAGRTIVLTTHFMDEADQLGDRIAILHKGQLKCVGTSLFLKKLYGVGYTLTLTRQHLQDAEHQEPDHHHDEMKTDSSELKSLVRGHISDAKLLSDVGTEVSFQLPLGASSAFPKLLKTLDHDGKEMGVLNYGLSVTTLEEVFLKVAHEEDETVEEQHETTELKRKLTRRRSTSNASAVSDVSKTEDILGASMKHRGVFRDFGALVHKRWNIQKRDKKATCCQFIAPIALLLIGFSLLRIPPNFTFPSIRMDPSWLYPDPVLTMYNDEPAHVPQTFIDHLDTQVSMIKAGKPVNSFIDMSQRLFDTMDDAKKTRYGAYYFDERPADKSFAYHMFINMTGAHSIPAFLNAANQAAYQESTKDAKAEIKGVIKPFPFTQEERSVIRSVNGLFASIVIALAFSFVPSAVAVFVTKDRETYCKHLQRISGVNMYAYWLSAYFWDFLTFMIPTAVGCVIIYAYGNANFVGENFPVVVINLVLYGASVIPFTYIFSFLFKSHSTAQNVMIMVYIFGGIIMLSLSVALYFIPSTREANSSYIRHLFRIVPNFCMADTMFWLSVRSQPFVDLSQWDVDVSGYNFLFMSFEAGIFFLVTLIIEYISSNPAVAAKWQSDPEPERFDDPNEDVDVVNERHRIQQGATSPDWKDIITIQGLRKTFKTADKNKNKIAVDNLWFSLPPGECFGFLGVNGAGKTTTLNMMTGRFPCTNGTAKLGGFDIMKDPENTRRLMGYCPQFDALYEHMTGEEHLRFYGRIRGVPEHKLESMVSYLINRLTLTPHAKKPAGTYSGGNKRKLSVGIALIGNPRVVFLDEPSTGMDPVSRRFMWDFINDSMTNRAVILTTHSMEECEALCSRIGILSLGKLKCIGTSQHLKHRFGSNLQLEITTGSEDVESARSFLQAEFPDSDEIEAYGGSLKYKVPMKEGRSLAAVFSLIEDNKKRVGISQYALGQTSLEQIFIQFAKEGDEELQKEFH